MRRAVLAIAIATALILWSDTRSRARKARYATREEREEIVRAIAELGWPADEVDDAIWVESGWSASAMHPRTRAAGLIQIMPWRLRQWGLTPEQFAAMEPLEQLPYLLRWWRGIRGEWRVPGDTYVALAASSHVGAPDDRVIYGATSAEARENPAWRAYPGGPVTAGSIRAYFARARARRKK